MKVEMKNIAEDGQQKRRTYLQKQLTNLVKIELEFQVLLEPEQELKLDLMLKSIFNSKEKEVRAGHKVNQ